MSNPFKMPEYPSLKKKTDTMCLVAKKHFQKGREPEDCHNKI